MSQRYNCLYIALEAAETLMKDWDNKDNDNELDMVILPPEKVDSLADVNVLWKMFYPSNIYLSSALKNFTKFSRKHLCWALFFNKVEGCTFVKISKNTFLQNTSGRLLSIYDGAFLQK